MPRAERLRAVLLALLVGVYVARPLLPSENPTTIAGDGLPFVMLTLALAAAWTVGQLVLPGRTMRFGLVDWAWIGLLGWQAMSTYLATRSGYARGAINAFWEWAGLGIGFLLLRQLMRSGQEKRAIAVVMIGLALMLSADGIYQFAIEYPETRERYRTQPDQVLADLELDAPPGSPIRMLFENRLESSEPTATFALTNSLAGFLVPWLLMTLAVGWMAGQSEGMAKTGYQGACAGVCALPLALCLLLTKSRAGYLAVLGGLAALLFAAWRTQRRIGRVVIAAALIGMVLLTIGYASGALDLEIITESLKSLSYRWHYWQGALGIIRDHPLFGCGPANFQDEYTLHKLPEASEVVADPHSLLFEIWATCGTPALILLVLILFAAAVESYRPQKGSTESDAQFVVAPSVARPWAPLIGGLVGLVLALGVGLFASVGVPIWLFLAGLVILPLVTVFFMPWIERGTLPGRVALICAAALVVNLLAAGGIGFAGVAGSLWLLLAIGGAADDRPRVSSGWAVAATAAASAALLGTCLVTAYLPVLDCRRLQALAELQPARAEEHLLAATKADSLADEPWRDLTIVDFALWCEKPSDELSDRWRHEQREFVRRRPHSSAAWLDAAQRSFAAYSVSADEEHRREFVNEAVEYYRRGVELYPNNAIAHARLALAMAAAGARGARAEALMALELDGQTPHADLKLRKKLTKEVQAVLRTVP